MASSSTLMTCLTSVRVPYGLLFRHRRRSRSRSADRRRRSRDRDQVLHPLGLHTDITPLLSHSAIGEFNFPPKYLRTPQVRVEPYQPLPSQYGVRANSIISITVGACSVPSSLMPLASVPIWSKLVCARRLVLRSPETLRRLKSLWGDIRVTLGEGCALEG
eukprot:682314-Pyramimonas_sp.AAC.1